MTTTLKEQAWQSDLVLPDETAEWDENDWPAFLGGAREYHASVVLDHPETENDSNNRGQTVVVLGGYQTGQGELNSILLLNLADQNKQWREGPPMNKRRAGHATVVCNGRVYVMGGFNRVTLDCIERIDANDLLQSSLTTTTTHESHWTTLTCRLSTRRNGCCAVAVHDRYIVVMGGCYNHRDLSSVDIIDTNNHIVTAGPSMTVPRSYCASAVIGHRIFVVGGCYGHAFLDSVEYLDYATPCDKDATKKEIGSASISFSATWTTHLELRLSNGRRSCAMVAVGSCLTVAGGWDNSTVEVLDTHRIRVWNLAGVQEQRWGCSMVTVANHVAVIGGWDNPTCATFPLLDKHTWCFRCLCEQPRREWYYCPERSGNEDVSEIACTISTSALKRLRTNT